MKFVFGPEEYLVNQEVQKFLKQFATKANIYDELTTPELIIMDIQTISMFANQKVIVVKDHPLLTDKNEGQRFLDQFRDLNRDNVHLLFALTSNHDPQHPFIKYLLANADTREVKTINASDLPDIIRDVVKHNGGQISNGAIIRMLQKFPINLRLIVNEVKKLLLENKSITEEQVEQSIDNYYSEDYFALSNAIVNANHRTVIKHYNEKITYGQKPVAIIGQIAITLNLALLIANYKKQGLSLKEIASELQIHIFRIKKANDLLVHQGTNQIATFVKKLAAFEFNIRAGKTNNMRGLDSFILELIK